ncbi:MAG: molybdate ABC transporter substrate-binding protein [Pseudomonadota bacterium]
MRVLLALLLGFALGGLSAATARAETLVFAAASLRNVLEDGAAPGTRLSFAGSGTIARQISAGAPADAIVLANAGWMAWLRDRGHIAPGAVRQVASNRLVIVASLGAAPLATPEALKPRLGTGRLAMGQRAGVPAGIYARQWLEHAGIWDDIKDHLAETDNVRAALLLVSRGEAPLGVVYASDVLASDQVTTVYDVPANSHVPIIYWAAALTPAGTTFIDALMSAEGQARFAAQGFLPVPE